MYHAEEGTGGCLCMFFPHQSQVQGNKNGEKSVNKGGGMFLDRGRQGIAGAIYVFVSGECFLAVLIDFLFLKILTKKAKKKSLFGQNFSFLGQKCQSFQGWEIDQGSGKTFPGYMCLDGFGRFLVIFTKKCFFTLVEKMLDQKIIFLVISHKYDFLAKNLTI